MSLAKFQIKKFVFILILIFLIGFVTAQNFIFQKGEYFTLEFPMTNVNLTPCMQCSCQISIFYPNGSSMLRNSAGRNVLGFCQFINKSEVLGVHGVDLFFTDGLDSGRTSFEFEVTLNGRPSPEGIIIIIFPLLFLILIIFSLIYFFKSLDLVINYNLDIINTTILVSCYLSLWILYYFSFEYLGNPTLNNLSEMALYVGGFTHLILPIIGFFICFVFNNLSAYKQNKITY